MIFNFNIEKLYGKVNVNKILLIESNLKFIGFLT